MLPSDPFGDMTHNLADLAGVFGGFRLAYCLQDHSRLQSNDELHERVQVACVSSLQAFDIPCPVIP